MQCIIMLYLYGMKPALIIILFGFCVVSCSEDDPDIPGQINTRHSTFSDGFGVFLNIDQEEGQWYSSYTTSLKTIEQVLSENEIEADSVKSMVLKSIKFYKNNQSNPDIISEPMLFSEVKVYLNNGTDDLLIAQLDEITSDAMDLDVEDAEIAEFHNSGALRYKVSFKLKERRDKVNSVAFTANYQITSND